MSNISKKIEAAANILIIVVAVLFVGILVERYFFSKSLNISLRESPTIGNKISLMDVDWSKSDKNVLLILQKGCHFCSESAEFYKKLIQLTQGKNVNIISILPQDKVEAEEYLKSLGISGIEVRQSQLKSLNISGTPTIITANNNGEISDFWIGKLPPDKETEVISWLIP